jgi:ATP-dependent DNA helicase RecG
MLRRLGIETIGDALALLPRRYDDRTNLKPIRSLQVGIQETFEGTILVSGSSRSGRGRRLYEMIVGDATGTIRCLWFQFHETYMRQRYRTGQRVIVTGEVRINPYSGQRKEIHHPDLELSEADEREPCTLGVWCRCIRPPRGCTRKRYAPCSNASWMNMLTRLRTVYRQVCEGVYT